MTLDIFAKKLGDADIVWPMDSDEQAELAVKVLDAVQTIVDVLVDGDVSYEAAFAATDSAYTEHSKHRISISAKPMLEGGRPFSEIASILTGFAVHEIGHTKERERQFTTALREEWPNKVTPAKLGNIIADNRLEATTIARFRGLRDVFIPTLDWVAKKTCPTWEIAYGKTLHDRLNFVGQVLRYAPFTKFATDAVSLREYAWWEDWGSVVNAETDNETMLRLVREGVEHIKVGAEYEPEPPVDDGGDFPGGKSNNPDEDGEPGEGNPDDDDTEGEGEGQGEDGDGDTEGGDTEGEDGDGEAEGEGEGEDGESKSKSTEGGDTEGEGKSESEDGEDGTEDGTDHVQDGQLGEGETLDRVETDEPMHDGAGGSGKAIAEASDVDEGLVQDKLNKSLDELTEGQDYREQYQQKRLQESVDLERVSTRIDAGAFGKMKVKVEW